MLTRLANVTKRHAHARTHFRILWCSGRTNPVGRARSTCPPVVRPPFSIVHCPLDSIPGSRACATLPYMERIGIRELQQQASGVLRRVRAGEDIEVTERGHPVAVLIPQRRGSALEALRAAGRVTSSEGDLLELGPPLPRHATVASASARLSRMRGTER